MRNVLFGLVITVAIVTTMSTNGCGGSGGGGTGKGGSSGSTSAPADCPNGSSCGGDVVGTWKVTSACLSLSGNMDASLLGMGCPSVPIVGTMNVTGTWTANASGTYEDNTTTTGSITFPLTTQCLTVSSVKVECSKMGGQFDVLGWPATCSLENGQCNCSATANKAGGIGVVSQHADKTGTYTTSSGGLNTDDAVDYSYCVSGETLTLTPKPKFLPVKGTIVLQNTSPGTGGSTGGSTGAGGASSGVGGATVGSGGKSSTGGASVSGGVTTGSGGATTGQGGATAGSGGRSVSGGSTTATGGATGTAGAGGGTTGAAGTTTATAGKSGTGGTTSTGGTIPAGTGKGPCDIYAAASNTCAAAHSTVRLLLSTYIGPLYQVKRTSDSKTQDIGVTAGGVADSAAQDAFCTSACVITKLYDQSGHGNYLSAETADAEDASVRPLSTSTGHSAASATADSLNVSGHKVYSLYTKTSQAYWRDGSKTGMPVGKEPQGIYMVTSGTHFSSGCCYDYGNGETSRTYVAGPSMDSVYFGNSTQWAHGTGSGPWIMADMEDGMVIGNSNTASITYKFVTAIEKNNGTTEWALRGADATTGALTTLYKGALPAGKNPMKKQGSIVLGSGGDCCYSNNNGSSGTFYEGAIVAGYPSDATEESVQANIVSAGYGK